MLGNSWNIDIKQFRNQPLRVVRELSCAQPPPFTWIARDIPEHRDALAFLALHYEIETDDREGLLVHRATAARSGLCAARRGTGQPRR